MTFHTLPLGLSVSHFKEKISHKILHLVFWIVSFRQVGVLPTEKVSGGTWLSGNLKMQVSKSTLS